MRQISEEQIGSVIGTMLRLAGISEVVGMLQNLPPVPEPAPEITAPQAAPPAPGPPTEHKMDCPTR